MEEIETLRRKMLRLVLPISFQQFMLALVGASDAVMLGKPIQKSCGMHLPWAWKRRKHYDRE